MSAEKVTESKNSGGIKVISWSAILAGSFVSLGLSFLLNLFAIATGLSAYQGGNGKVSTLAVGGLIALALGIMIIMFLSGWVAGFLGWQKSSNWRYGGIYGFIVWSIALVFAILLGAHVGRFLATFAQFVINPTYASLYTTIKTASTATDPATLQATGGGTFVVFLLFFLGAFSSCIGGYVGLRSGEKKE